MKTFLMLCVRTCLLASLVVVSDAQAGEEFYSISQLNAAEGALSFYKEIKSIDHIFHTENTVAKLAATKRVRMLPRPVADEVALLSFALSKKDPLKDKLESLSSVVEVSEADFRPVLNLAGDFSNYGDRTICGFETGATLLIGEGEPEYVVKACFKCHDIVVIRRPNDSGTEVQRSTFGMSPELESALFALAKKMFPKDEELQKFQLAARTRATGPPQASPLPEIPASLR